MLLADNKDDGSQNPVIVPPRTEANEQSDGTPQEAVLDHPASLASLLKMVLQSPLKHQGKITSSSSVTSPVTLEESLLLIPKGCSIKFKRENTLTFPIYCQQKEKPGPFPHIGKGTFWWSS